MSLTSTPTFIDHEHLMFTCTVKNSVNLIDLVCFQRHAPSFNWCINQNLNGCYPVRSRDYYEMRSRYTTHCGEGTNSTESHMKIYSLSIVTPSDRDAQQWWCELRFRGARSSFVKLNHTGKYLSVGLMGEQLLCSIKHLSLWCLCRIDPPPSVKHCSVGFFSLSGQRSDADLACN